MAMSDWMWRKLNGDERLCEITMPGSHDAGVFASGNVTKRMGFRDAYAVCQNVDFFKQAEAGSRFFDCRVFVQPSKETDKGSDAIEKRLRFGHFGNELKMPGVTLASGAYFQKGIGGAYGGSLFSAVTDAARFVRNHDKEFLIFRFSHTANGDKVEAAFAKWLRNQAVSDYVYTCDGTSGNIANTEIRHLRGKVILIFDTKQHKVTANEQSAGLHPFIRVTSGTEDCSHGLGICGEFKGTSDIDAVESSAEKGASEHARHFNDRSPHLHFVYLQRTLRKGKNLFTDGGSVKKATLKSEPGMKRSEGEHKLVGPYVDSLLVGERRRFPNVISHDFVSEGSCTPIIDLNDRWRRG